MSEPLHPEVAILGAALELPSGERAAFVAQACAGDAALQGQVEALLRAHEDAAAFLEGPASPVPPRRVWNVSPSEKAGDRLGRYKLVDPIGEGGCGVVWLAEQEEPVRRRVALKVIKLGMDTKQVIARFEAERQALALMDHPNIAKVLDAGATHTGRPYFVMELVRGMKFTDYCRENHVSMETRLRLFTQVCQAIQHAHQKGIIHRDIKPSNILVTVNDGVPVPKVIDFGIAKATQGRLTEETIFTAFEQFMGTPAYTSPEQAAMAGADIDTRADIYSLGVLLYELLTGRTPFDQRQLLACGLDEMRRIIREVEPEKPSTRLAQAGPTPGPAERHRLIPLLRGDLDWIVMKCLEKDRARRYETANGLALDIERHLRHEPVSARPTSRAYQFRKLAQRHRMAFAAAGVALAAVLLALIVLGVSRARVGQALQAAQASEQRAKDGLFAALRNQAQARRYSGQMGRRFDSLAAIAEANALRRDPTLRDDAIAALAMADVRRALALESGATNVIALASTPALDRCASLTSDGIVRVWSAAERRELRRFETGQDSGQGSRLNRLLFSPDGRLLAHFRAGMTPLVWRLADGEVIVRHPPQSCGALDFSPDSRRIALADAEWVVTFDADTGGELRRWQAGGAVYGLAFSPDGRRIAASLPGKKTASVFDAASGEKQADLPCGAYASGVVCWHPDNTRLAVISAGADIEIWNVDVQRKVATLRGHTPEVTTLSFHPDGGLLASAGWDGTLRLWEPARGRPVMRLPFAAQLQFSADGRWLGVQNFSEGRVHLLEIGSAGEYHTLVSSLGAENSGYYDCTVSHVHPLFVAGMADGVRLWDLESRVELGHLESGLTFSVVFAPDGRSLLTSGSAGLLRWPIQAAGPTGTELTFGPPKRIALPFVPGRIALSRNGRLLGVQNDTPGRTGATLVDLESGTVRGKLLPHVNISYVAVSPDARWLATGGWHSGLVRLWDAQTGEQVQELAMGRATQVGFTPDSRRLVTATSREYAFFELDSLKAGPRFARETGLHPAEVAFSPDGKLMVMELSPGVLHLKEVATGRTVVQLEDPFADRTSKAVFTPDGTRLIALAPYAGAAHIWDLRALRVQLKPMGLDWDWPEFSPPAPAAPSRPAGLAGLRPALKIRVLTTQ